MRENFSGTWGIHIVQKVVQTEQVYQSHQFPPDLDTYRRKKIPFKKGGPRFPETPVARNILLERSKYEEANQSQQLR